MHVEYLFMSLSVCMLDPYGREVVHWSKIPKKYRIEEHSRCIVSFFGARIYNRKENLLSSFLSSPASHAFAFAYGIRAQVIINGWYSRAKEDIVKISMYFFSLMGNVRYILNGTCSPKAYKSRGLAKRENLLSTKSIHVVLALCKQIFSANIWNSMRNVEKAFVQMTFFQYIFTLQFFRFRFYLLAQRYEMDDKREGGLEKQRHSQF